VVNGTTSQSRAAILELGGAPGAAATVICPDATKIYIVRNDVSGGFAATIKTSAGTGVTIPNGKVAAVYCDGVNVKAATEFFSTVDIDGGTIDGTTIGATSASTGAFTTLSSTSTTTLNGTTIPASATLTKTTDKLNVFAATTSAELAGVISDETGTGALVFAGSPALTGTPTAPTAAAGTNTTQLATTAHVFAERSNTATLTNKTLTSPTITGTGTAAFGNLSYTGTLTGSTGILNIGSGQIYKDASGNVGVGETSPLGKLEVNATNAGNNVDTLFITNKSINAGTATSVVLGPSNFPTIRHAAIKATNGGANDISLAFITANATTPSERMRITAAGDVGIGTPTPTNSKVHINSATALDTYLKISNVNASTGFDFGITSTGDGLVWHRNNFPIRFGTNNAERMRIDSAGNVGIGTSSPNSKLTVEGTLNVSNGVSAAINYTSTGALTLGSTAAEALVLRTNAAERMRIDSAGNVGIGTSSPAAKLDVLSAIAITGTAPVLQFRKNDNNLDNALFYDNSTSDNRLFVGRDSNILSFRTNTTERMRIDSSGNVGIGTSSPAAKLGVTGANTAMASEGLLRLGADANGADIGTQITFGNDTARRAAIAGRQEGASGSAGYLQFGTRGTSGDITERARIDASGNLLVGTTTIITNDPGVRAFTSGFINAARNGEPTGIFNRNTSDGILLQFRRSGTNVGSINVTGSATSYVTSSDYRLKENITDAPSASDSIDAIQIRSFDWKADGSHQKYGVIAQELEPIAPEAVSKGEKEDDMWGVDYSKLVPMLIKEVQSLRARVAQLEGN
jgi:hypothetical protein